jgi:hypothetical protein
VEYLRFNKKPKAEVHPGRKLTGEEEEEEEEEEGGGGGGKSYTSASGQYHLTAITTITLSRAL